MSIPKLDFFFFFCNLGKTVQLNQDGPEDEDLSIDRLVSDFVELVQVIFPEPTKAPSLVVRSLTLKM